MKIVLAFLAGLMISEGYALTKEEKREQRRAIERKYEACTANCQRNCIRT